MSKPRKERSREDKYRAAKGKLIRDVKTAIEKAFSLGYEQGFIEGKIFLLDARMHHDKFIEANYNAASEESQS